MTATEYQLAVAARAETEYGLLVRADAVELPDRNGMVFCQSQYLATARYGRLPNGDWGRTLDVARFKFDRGAEGWK